MRCNSSILVGNSFKPCCNEATEILWCPTWISAGRGPINVCANHAKGFKPEFNPHAKDGEFYWGNDAQAAYIRIGTTRQTRF